MKLIKPSVQLIDEPDLFKRIELAGRTCYKSEQKISESSAYPFYQSICNRGHESVLEHSNIIVRTHTAEMYLALVDLLTEYTGDTGLPHYIRYTQFDKFEFHEFNEPELYCRVFADEHVFSGNLRAWRNLARRFRNEAIIVSLFRKHTAFYDIFDDESTYWDYDEFPSEEIEIVDDVSGCSYEDRHTIKTVRIVANRGVIDEFARHRAFAHSVESTRYCNYAKDNVTDDGCVFVYPSWYFEGKHESDLLPVVFYNICKDSDEAYANMMYRTKTPQTSRGALNLWVKSEHVMTGTVEQWKEFLRLRDSSKAHPDAQQMAKMIREVLEL